MRKGSVRNSRWASRLYFTKHKSVMAPHVQGSGSMYLALALFFVRGGIHVALEGVLSGVPSGCWRRSHGEERCFESGCVYIYMRALEGESSNLWI